MGDSMTGTKMYKLQGSDGTSYMSPTKGKLGGNRETRRYGRLDCSAALTWIARGKYVNNRVFFADEATAIKAGYRPCWLCCRPQYIVWKRGPRVRDGKAR